MSRLLAIALLLVPGQVLAQAKPHQLVPDPHRHVVAVHAFPWATDLAPEARVVEVTDGLAGVDTVVSPNARWRASVVQVPEEPGGRIRLEDQRSGRVYELQGIPLPYRPLSDLVWLDHQHLAFDRWSQPHYGLHYVLDVERAQLVLAAPFPDEFFLRLDRPARRPPQRGGLVHMDTINVLRIRADLLLGVLNAGGWP